MSQRISEEESLHERFRRLFRRRCNTEIPYTRKNHEELTEKIRVSTLNRPEVVESLHNKVDAEDPTHIQ